jgi:cation:H+ antiporter
MLIDILLLIIGLGLLYYGGDLLVLGCIRISRIYKVSPFVIGATIMGFGTSAPELAVSILAALKGSPELALGNIVGSNIANIGLVLGLTTLLTPLIIAPSRFKESLPSLLIATFLLLIFTWDNYLSRLEGGLMAFGLILYLWRILSRRDEGAVEMEEDDGKFFPKEGVAVQSILVVVGLILLVLGADFMVKGGANIARALGVSEWLIGISIIAVGTSLPEIISSIMSVRRGHGEMALGNIFGSNIFNILMVLGTTAIIAPLKIIDKIHPDLLFTTGLTCLLLAVIRMGYRLSKANGIILLACYFLYMGLKSSGMF